MTPEQITQTAFLRGRVVHGGTAMPVDGELEVKMQEGSSILKVLDELARGVCKQRGNGKQSNHRIIPDQ